MICILIDKVFTYINNMAFWIIILNEDNVKKLCCCVGVVHALSTAFGCLSAHSLTLAPSL